MRLRPWAALLTIALAGAGAVACGSASDDDSHADTDELDVIVAPVEGADLTVHLTNWDVIPSQREVSSGTLKVAAVHPADHETHSGSGGDLHQLVIARLKPGAKHGSGAYSELVLNLTDIKVGETKMGEVTLEPGEYELACLLVEKAGDKSYDHYKEGMHTNLTVK
jgi:hypothetical protein